MLPSAISPAPAGAAKQEQTREHIGLDIKKMLISYSFISE
jgi:hypothetical protein